ncbi:MAG: hypothetical protein JXQ85_06950 [Cognatishimia sp.]|uniref:hypothetical protein n=1 Tax=Cognatishimia sp. TaxID=2211648 RepID=UPI003B8EA4C6
MKLKTLLFAAIALTGCDQIKDEFYTPGGYVSPVLNKTTFRAITQSEQLDRYHYILAVSAPLALYTVSDEESAEDTITHVSKALKKLKSFHDAQLKCVNSLDFNTQTSASSNCTYVLSEGTEIKSHTESRYGFETNSLSVQREMARIASDIKNNIGLQIDTTSPLSSVDDVVSLIVKAKDLLGPLRNFAAAYRDTIHIVSFSTARNCTHLDGAPPKFCKALQDDLIDLHQDGRIPTLGVQEGIDPKEERALKTLRTRFVNVIESKELSQIGFLDDEGRAALNSQIFTACIKAARFTDWDQSERAETCSAIKIPKIAPIPIGQATTDAPQAVYRIPS